MNIVALLMALSCFIEPHQHLPALQQHLNSKRNPILLPRSGLLAQRHRTSVRGKEIDSIVLAERKKEPDEVN